MGFVVETKINGFTISKYSNCWLNMVLNEANKELIRLEDEVRSGRAEITITVSKGLVLKKDNFKHNNFTYGG